MTSEVIWACGRVLSVAAVIAVPHDEKSRVLRMGRYQGASEAVQVVQPVGVMNELLETVLTIQDYAIAALAIIGAALGVIIATIMMPHITSIRTKYPGVQSLKVIMPGDIEAISDAKSKRYNQLRPAIASNPTRVTSEPRTLKSEKEPFLPATFSPVTYR